MTNITLNVAGAKVQAVVNGLLTSGMVGIPVTIHYDEAWNGLTKNFVCRCGKWGADSGEIRTILGIGETATVAHEVMQANKRLYLGVEGYSTDGKLVIPTTWADCGLILPGTNAGADLSTDPTLSVWAQLQAEIEQIKQDTVTEEDITAAVAAYMEENPIEIPDSPQKVNLPLNEDGTPNYGTAGYYAVSDGAGGITWVAAGNTGGDSGGTEEPDVPGVITCGIIWNLVNVSSSNPATSVNEGASLVAVLTPVEGYNLGDVTITMGGEAVTGAWTAETATVVIPRVTGDVVISCAGVEQTEPVTVELPFLGQGGSNITPASGTYETVVSKFGTGNYAYFGGEIDAPGTLNISHPEVFNEGTYPRTKVVLYDADGNHLAQFAGQTTGASISAAEWGDGSFYAFCEMDTGVSVDIPIKYKNAKYVIVGFNRGSAENDTVTSNGSFIVYIRENATVTFTNNINSGAETSAAQMVDNDYLQDYGVATLSLTTDVEDATTFEGVLETAKNAWMTAYGGDMNKIPIIVHTDQHGHMRRDEAYGDVFDTISSMVNWYDISKVINLGDTANSYGNFDNLIAGSQTLENYLDATSEVPFSKRIEIFGNHDVCYFEGAMLTVIYHDQSYLQPYFRNIFARKTSNNGYFVVKDDNFNVKYIAISGFEFDETWPNKYVISSRQIDWLITELSKADGYDVVLLSHVPIDSETWGRADISAIISARRDKTSGAITDGYEVTHSFDFSGCDGELLCSLHGHLHDDISGYNGNVLYNVFSQFSASTTRCLYFALIDRANRQLNVWKVDNTPQYLNYQIPLDQPETIE